MIADQGSQRPKTASRARFGSEAGELQDVKRKRVAKASTFLLLWFRELFRAASAASGTSPLTISRLNHHSRRSVDVVPKVTSDSQMVVIPKGQVLAMPGLLDVIYEHSSHISAAFHSITPKFAAYRNPRNSLPERIATFPTISNWEATT